MNTATAPEITPIIGTAMAGGYYGGRIRINGQIYALIVAPKGDGEVTGIAWHDDEPEIAGAKSYDDGLDNTEAMLAAGSGLAKWARDLRIGGHDDWYLPAQDELEVLYRNLKPTAAANYCYARSGINISAVNPTRPYTKNAPAQTAAEAFQAGAEQAFDADWYWSSTRHAEDTAYAWGQDFDYGGQDSTNASWSGGRARAVRRLPI